MDKLIESKEKVKKEDEKSWKEDEEKEEEKAWKEDEKKEEEKSWKEDEEKEALKNTENKTQEQKRNFTTPTLHIDKAVASADEEITSQKLTEMRENWSGKQAEESSNNSEKDLPEAIDFKEQKRARTKQKKKLEDLTLKKKKL